jgi:hypothetical protein
VLAGETPVTEAATVWAIAAFPEVVDLVAPMLLAALAGPAETARGPAVHEARPAWEALVGAPGVVAGVGGSNS